jgi:hypothetical protein
MIIEAITAGLSGRISQLSPIKQVQKSPSEQQSAQHTEKSESLDRVTLSEEAKSGGINKSTKTYDSSGRLKTGAANEENLTEEEQSEVEKMKNRDEEVRTHEMKHKTAGAPYTSGPYYEYDKGPDGRRYVTGGHVNIDTSEVPDNPEATIRKAQKIQASASAPAGTSSEDKQVAAKARAMEQEARQELNEKNMEQSGRNSAGNTVSAYRKTFESVMMSGAFLDLSA